MEKVRKQEKEFKNIFILSTGDYVLDAFLTFGEAYDAILKTGRVDHKKRQIIEASNSVYDNTICFNISSLPRRYKYHIIDLRNYYITTYIITKISVSNSAE